MIRQCAPRVPRISLAHQHPDAKSGDELRIRPELLAAYRSVGLSVGAGGLLFPLRVACAGMPPA